MNGNVGDIGWTTEISPRRAFFDLRLWELWQARDLVLLFVARDFIAAYRQTILGPMWHIVQPLLTTITLTIIFGRIAQLPSDGTPHFLFYLSGTVIWGYFAACVTSTSDTLAANAQLFGKVYFSRLAVPIAVVLSRLIAFLIQCLVLAVAAAFAWVRGANVHPAGAALLIVPALVAMTAACGLASGLLVSALTTRYRDLQLLVTFGVTLLLYATPIIYPASAVPGRYRLLLALNPLASIVETFRHVVLGSGTFDLLGLARSAASIAVLLALALLVFRRVEATFMDTV